MLNNSILTSGWTALLSNRLPNLKIMKISNNVAATNHDDTRAVTVHQFIMRQYTNHKIGAKSLSESMQEYC